MKNSDFKKAFDTSYKEFLLVEVLNSKVSAKQVRMRAPKTGSKKFQNEILSMKSKSSLSEINKREKNKKLLFIYAMAKRNLHNAQRFLEKTQDRLQI